MSNQAWVLVADGARAVLLAVDDEGRCTTLEQFLNPHGRGHDIARERPARTHESVGTARHAIAPRTPEKDKHRERFARELGAILDNGCLDQAQRRLFLVAPPRFLGMLKAMLGKNARSSLAGEVAKDLTHCEPARLEALVSELVTANARSS